jgi:hypothetical protein
VNTEPETNVKVFEGHIIIESLDIFDEDLASYIKENDEKEWPDLIRRGVKIGLIALKGSRTTEKLDYVEKEFNKLSKKLSDNLDDFARKKLEKIFDEDNGILKQTMDTYLGIGGKLEDLFDPEQKGSAMSKFSTILDDHFKGSDSEFAKLLDHENPDSPIASLKNDLIKNYLKDMRDKLIGEKEAEKEREKGTAKGRKYQEDLFQRVNDMCGPFQDTPDYTADVIGKLPKSKVGDVVVTINPNSTGGAVVKMVFEAKDSGSYNIAKTQKELDEAKENRDACVGVAVFTSNTCPIECYPLYQYGNDKVICTYDLGVDELSLNLAYRMARIEALRRLNANNCQQIDSIKIRSLVISGFDKLKSISNIKRKITELSNGVSKDLDDLQNELRDLFTELDSASQLTSAT